MINNRSRGCFCGKTLRTADPPSSHAFFSHSQRRGGSRSGSSATNYLNMGWKGFEGLQFNLLKIILIKEDLGSQVGGTQCQTAVHNFSWRGEKVALSWSVFVFSLGRIGVPLHIKARGRNTEKLNFQPQWLLQMKSKGWGSMGPFSGGECFLKESQQWTCLAFGGPCPPIVHTPRWLPSLWARYALQTVQSGPWTQTEIMFDFPFAQPHLFPCPWRHYGCTATNMMCTL